MDYIYAFLIGGVICVIGQILFDTTKLTMPGSWCCLSLRSGSDRPGALRAPCKTGKKRRDGTTAGLRLQPGQGSHGWCKGRFHAGSCRRIKKYCRRIDCGSGIRIYRIYSFLTEIKTMISLVTISSSVEEIQPIGRFAAVVLTSVSIAVSIVARINRNDSSAVRIADAAVPDIGTRT